MNKWLANLSEHAIRTWDERVALLHDLISDVPPIQDGETAYGYVKRIVYNLSQDEASDLITQLIIIQQGETLAEYLSQPGDKIINDTARAIFQKGYDQCNRHERRRIEKALRGNLVQAKSPVTRQSQPGQL